MNAKHEQGKISVPVNSINVHDDWNPNTSSFDADIAIITLDRVVQFNEYIQPICLTIPNSIPASITISYVVGFGSGDSNKFGVASIMTSPIVHNRKCIEEFPDVESLLSPRSFCGGYSNGTGVCDGDSGSGLFVQHDGAFYLRGVVSSSLADALHQCNVNSPSVFTDAVWFYNYITSGGIVKNQN